jgi:hypothetical protein
LLQILRHLTDLFEELLFFFYGNARLLNQRPEILPHFKYWLKLEAKEVLDKL